MLKHDIHLKFLRQLDPGSSPGDTQNLSGVWTTWEPLRSTSREVLRGPSKHPRTSLVRVDAPPAVITGASGVHPGSASLA